MLTPRIRLSGCLLSYAHMRYSSHCLLQPVPNGLTDTKIQIAQDSDKRLPKRTAIGALAIKTTTENETRHCLVLH